MAFRTFTSGTGWGPEGTKALRTLRTLQGAVVCTKRFGACSRPMRLEGLKKAKGLGRWDEQAPLVVKGPCHAMHKFVGRRLLELPRTPLRHRMNQNDIDE